MSSAHLDPQLLFSQTTQNAKGTFAAVLDAHGTYSTMQFVLRLSPRIHRILSSRPSGIYSSSEAGFEHAQAFSTLLHETVHWWQHIGSTYGFILSLTYPLQAHNNYAHLRRLVKEVGFKKDIRNLVNQLDGPTGIDTVHGLANIIINNHFDFGAFRGLTYDVGSLKATVEHPMFENVGHAFQLTYGNCLLMLGGTIDPQHVVIPNPRGWSEEFRKLRESKEESFYFGSPVDLHPIGIREIFEGQACFSQLQYLAFASGDSLGWEDFRRMRMLHGVYEEAFKRFLELAELDWPPNVIHPTVGLFLLICDMTINPGSGFPFPVLHYPSFIADVDPATRFAFLARVARTECSEVLVAIQTYSREEYVEVTGKLAKALVLHPPIAVARECARWAETETIARVMEEYRTFAYEPLNLPIRVLFSHFLAFMQDKVKVPEFFCWPGAWSAGEKVSEEGMALFNRHQALFVDKEDDDGVFPRLQPGRDEKHVQAMFDSFYGANVVYDLADQWITKPGPFMYDYSWLSSSGTRQQMKEFADRQFMQAFGVHPDVVDLIEDKLKLR